MVVGSVGQRRTGGGGRIGGIGAFAARSAGKLAIAVAFVGVAGLLAALRFHRRTGCDPTHRLIPASSHSSQPPGGTVKSREALVDVALATAPTYVGTKVMDPVSMSCTRWSPPLTVTAKTPPARDLRIASPPTRSPAAWA
jgi:hypothetical protein